MTLTKGRIERTGKIHFGDASLSIWEDGEPEKGQRSGLAASWERQFKTDVFARVVQTLNRLGWECNQPDISKHDQKHYGGNVARWASERRRFCRKGDLFGELEIGGRTIKFDMWQGVNTPTRPDHGGRYEHDKEGIMPYVLWLEMERARRRIRDYLCNVFTGYEFKAPDPKCGPEGATALECAAHRRRTSGHYRPELDRANISMESNARAADGGIIEHGAKVWAIDRKGRVITGTAYYSLNSSWDIVTGKYGLTYAHTGEMFTEQPQNLRVKRNATLRRKRLESELQKAVAAMDFERAATLRDIVFPKGEPLFYLWHTRHELYHCIGFSGYSKDTARAGKFTAAELKGWHNHQDKIIPVEAA